MVLITQWEYLFLHKRSQISFVENSVKMSVTSDLFGSSLLVQRDSPHAL